MSTPDRPPDVPAALAEQVAVARRYADAYAAFDVPALLAVLDPNLRFRQVNPGGCLELGSAQEYIDTSSEFIETYDCWEADFGAAEPLSDLVATVSRIRLHRGGQEHLMQHSEIVSVAGGRVTSIDSACSGARNVDGSSQ